MTANGAEEAVASASSCPEEQNASGAYRNSWGTWGNDCMLDDTQVVVMSDTDC
jgi:hypothetical protein